LIILNPLPNATPKQIINHSEHIAGPFTDPQAIAELASKVDILTVEIKPINVGALEETQNAHSSRGLEVQPTPFTLRTIQDKFLQKEWLAARPLPVAPP